jgi:tRNA G18 (ribose-2'-O)-methylase SpoU
MRVEAIATVDDPRIADYRDLRDAPFRRARELFIVESHALVLTLLDARPASVRSLLVTPGALERLRDALDAAGVTAPVYVAPDALLADVVGFRFHRGALAVAARGEDQAPAALLAGLGAGPAVVLVCEGIGNPDNVGGIFRNAMAFGAGAVLLGPGCGDPLYRKTIRTSMGGALRVPFAHLRAWPDDLGLLVAAGFTLVALTPAADALDIAALGDRLGPRARVALLLGTEWQGLSAAAHAAAELAVRIPIAAGVDSLNVATAAGIALHRLAPLSGAARARHDDDGC